MAKRNLRAWRGDAEGGKFEEYEVDSADGMVVLDLVHLAQAEHHLPLDASRGVRI